MNSPSDPPVGEENFATLFEESFGSGKAIVGSILAGKVVALENDCAVIDVGLKAEGRVPLKEFDASNEENRPQLGDTVDVFVERLEDRNGEIQISREKVRRKEAWQRLEAHFLNKDKVLGTITQAVKGGFTVDLDGASAFLPGSLVDIRSGRGHAELIDQEQELLILKMDAERNNIVVSRRAVMEEERAGKREKVVESLEEGRIMEGVVKNITDYGAFIDLGGIDGLLHVTDMSWKRVNHPKDVLNLGDTLKVQVIRYSAETQRVSLGIKQLEKNPWDDVQEKYIVGAKTTGRVTRITDYGAFVELEPGVEGLVHVSEMSWMRKTVQPSKIVSVSEEVDVQILNVDLEKKRISLGMKTCHPNPWEAFAEQYKEGDELEGVVKNAAEFGLFLSLPCDADGLVHITDLVWEGSPEEAMKTYKRGDKVNVRVLEINVKKERVSLGIKQTLPDPFLEATAGLKKDSIVTCTVKEVQANGILVVVAEGVKAFIRRNDLARVKADQRPTRFAPGEKVDAKVLGVDQKARKMLMSIKAREIAEAEEIQSTYGSADSGALLGEILGKAIEEKQAREKKAVKDKPKKATADKPAKAAAAKVEQAVEQAAKPKAKPKKKTEAKTTETEKTEAKTAEQATPSSAEQQETEEEEEKKDATADDKGDEAEGAEREG